MRPPVTLAVRAGDDGGVAIGAMTRDSAVEREALIAERAPLLHENPAQYKNAPERDTELPNVQGLKGPFGCLNRARYGIAWGALGAAQACYDESLSYCKDRVQFSRPIAGYQLVQAKLVEMVEEITVVGHRAVPDGMRPVAPPDHAVGPGGDDRLRRVAAVRRLRECQRGRDHQRQ